MDVPVINTTNFVEPTEKYCTELKKNNLSCNVKLWFNGDLLQWTYYYKNVKEKDKEELNKAYKEFCDFYNVTITPEDLKEKFNDYPVDDFSNLSRYLIHKTANEQT
jgi:hypothetical protein